MYPSGTDMHLKELKFSFFVLGFKFVHFKKLEPIRALLFFAHHCANSNTARIPIQVRYTSTPTPTPTPTPTTTPNNNNNEFIYSQLKVYIAVSLLKLTNKS